MKAPIPRKQGLKLIIIGWERQNCKKWKRPFQENKDWNCTKQYFEGPNSSVWKRPFQENKDWNVQLRSPKWILWKVKAPIPRKQGLKLIECSRYTIRIVLVKAPIPRKQGLKLLNANGIWKMWMSESAHSKKTRIETGFSSRWETQQKDGESAHSKKTRIETLLDL